MDRLRVIWSKGSYVESATRTAARSDYVVNLYLLCLHTLFLSLHHPSLVIRLLHDGKLSRLIFNDFVDYGSKIQFNFQPEASLYTDLMLLHFTTDLYNLVDWVKTDNIYHSWFANLLFNCGRIHRMNPMHRAHIVQKSYVIPNERNKYLNVCKYCIEVFVERYGLRYNMRALHHLCETTDNYPSIMLQNHDVWCMLCKVVPLIQIMRGSECVLAYGTYAHKCKCFNEVFCIHCNDGIRNCWVRYEDSDIYVDIGTALRFRRPNVARRRLFQHPEPPRADIPLQDNRGIQYISDESLSSMDEPEEVSNIFYFFYFFQMSQNADVTNPPSSSDEQSRFGGLPGPSERDVGRPIVLFDGSTVDRCPGVYRSGSVFSHIPRFIRRVEKIHFRETSRLLSDVVPFRNTHERHSIFEWLQTCGAGYPNQFYLYSEHGDHFHVVHDCPFAGSQCRCRWRQAATVSKNIRRRLGRRRPFLSSLKRGDWINIFIYFVLHGFGKTGIWCGREKFGLQSPFVLLRPQTNDISEGRLAAQNKGDGCNICEGWRNGSADTTDAPVSLQAIKKSGGRFQTYIKEVKNLLEKYFPVPLENIKTLISPNSSDFNVNLFDPLYAKQFSEALEIYKLSLNWHTLCDFKSLFNNKLPVFYSNNVNPFEYYHDEEDSFKYIMKLLAYQFQNDEDKIKTFLKNIVRWFNREGWLMEDGSVNSKLNTVVCIGPPNCGKNYFWDCLVSLACNVGHIGRVNNKTNNFALQECVNRRLIVGNEISMEEGAKEDFKKLCEGTALNVRVKHKSDCVINKTPVLLISNSLLFLCSDPAFKDIRCKIYYWTQFEELKNSDKKPYPLVIFKVLDYFEIQI
uniref:Nonstructural protein n=1 Tax=Lanius cristatus ambidensovirus TaxID=2794461 RepID=A0A8A4XEM4_9VIRU|nr:MAG: nonstructural protein [Lanius cristatus ambidensovirus]